MRNEKPDYANWVPQKFVILLGVLAVLFLSLFLLSFLLSGSIVVIVIRVLLSIITAFFLFFFLYFCYARHLLSYEGRGAQGKILENVLNYLDWEGNGKLLDIGCGSGAMAIMAAKRFSNAQITGIDYWGGNWDYAKDQCERNAEIEGVSDRSQFQQGTASHLDFPDGTFDAAVSNLVFHEVKDQPDKLALIKEAFRVIKPGGVFAFEDVFYSKSYYKDLDGLIASLTDEVSELHFVDTRKNDFIPKGLATPFVIGDIGLIYGKK